MDKLAALHAFTAVAQAGGFSRAARKLGMATSSLTRQMDALEASLGTALLTRSTRQVMLTDAGVSYLEQVSRAMDALALADASIADLDHEPAGPLRVSLPVTFGRLCLGPHIAAFLQRYPKVSLHMQLTDANIDLHAERIDVVVRIGAAPRQPDLIVRRLSDHERYVVGSHDYLARAGTPLQPQDLAAHECLRFAYDAGPQRWTFEKEGARTQVDVRGRLEANNADMVREALLGGLGVALLARWLVEEDVTTGRVRRLFEDYVVNPTDRKVCVYAAYLPNRRHSQKVRAFVDFLAERVGGM
jgi:DNA-binding transcriptional LysR family regulator